MANVYECNDGLFVSHDHMEDDELLQRLNRVGDRFEKIMKRSNKREIGRHSYARMMRSLNRAGNRLIELTTAARARGLLNRGADADSGRVDGYDEGGAARWTPQTTCGDTSTGNE